ncbi:MAG: hypothetical protein IJU29_08450 [Oscillospiraceae bacterium]|nr:hypothetical protein [Oscillospiraceae bacterium]
MDYDKRSFLAGLAAGRQMKGWAVVVGDAPECIRTTGARIVHRGSRQDAALGALPMLTAADAPGFDGVMLYTQGGYRTVALGDMAQLSAVKGESVSGAGMESVCRPLQNADLGSMAALTAGNVLRVSGAGMENITIYHEITGDVILPGVVTAPGVSGVSMELDEQEDL